MKTKNKKIMLRYGENPNQNAYLINNQKIYNSTSETNDNNIAKISY